MSKAKAVAIGIVVLLASPAASQTRTVYVPGVNVAKSVVLPSYVFPQYLSLGLISNLMIYNNGSTTARATKVRWYGTEGPHQAIDGGRNVAPGQSISERTIDFPEYGIEIAQYELPGDLVATATLELWHFGFPDVACGPYPTVPEDHGSVSQGRVPLPVFEGLFPAGTVVVSGDVVPFNPGPPPEICSQEYGRRINLTLFNAGAQPTTFAVKARRGGSASEVFSSTYEVPAETVRQFNSIYSPPHTYPEYEDTSHLWFTITADQPFLSYVSTTFENPMPGAIQYEIFPSKLK